MPQFSHLHVHSQFSLLDGAAGIPALIAKCKNDGMTSVALTDHGNMFGAFSFVAEAKKHGIKPIVGCEFYMVTDRHRREFTKDQKDVRHHQLMLAKNAEGYKNLSKLCSAGYTDGLYGKFPRIDKTLIEEFHKGLIATSCCIGAEIPQAIIKGDMAKAEELLKWWLNLLGEDFYIELQRHDIKDIDRSGLSQEGLNQKLLYLAEKYDVKTICTNDSHYIDQGDAKAHEILLCVNTGSKLSEPIGDGKGHRFAFPNDQFYFKTQSEMNELFADVAEAIDYTQELADKIEPLQLTRDVLMPNFIMPEGFISQDDYLRHLAFQGAKKRYPSLDQEVEERLDFELSIIQKMGFAGYFLIVQDFINTAREMKVGVGPGRGSAAGSVVAYCVGITNIDPIAYKLLFERFLNPERVSMPDIDIDFEDEGRSKVIDYVVKKYGRNQVAQIITFGSMAAKSSIKDVARVMDLPLDQSNALAKLVPERAGTTLASAFKEVPELSEWRVSDDPRGEVIRTAEKLEGSVRNTGVHASAIIIAPDDITQYIPVATSKETDLLLTQFDGKYIESAGMLKMDFLGLKTLSIIKDALALIKKRQGIDIDIDKLDPEDKTTYALFQAGDTVGTFQFESDGMRQYLKDLKPTCIEDLVAMNALFRPGPMQFIPQFINRKHGREKVEYPHPLLEPILRDTYGIMVYQEQIMQAAQIIAGYSLGGADILRRAMGKKDREKMAKERVKFVQGAADIHQIPAPKAEEVFTIMERFAEYGFNRSHSAAYSVVAYQTGFLKANYPSEYMASVLTHNMNNTERLHFFIEECKHLGIKVLGPDINESDLAFSVNQEGHIRMGLLAIRGVGEGAVEDIILHREEEGNYTSIFDLTRKVDLRTVNKRCIECMVYAGAFDTWANTHRAQYLSITGEGLSLIDKAIKRAAAGKISSDNGQMGLFMGGSTQMGMFGSDANQDPPLPGATEMLLIDKLRKEKEMVGFYLSGHPLDDFSTETKFYSTSTIKEIHINKGKAVCIACIVTNIQVRRDKRGTEFGIHTIEDYSGSVEFRTYSESYLKYKHLLDVGNAVLIKGTVQARYGNESETELRLTEVMMLDGLHDKYVKGITLKMLTDTLSPTFIDTLALLSEKHRGKVPMRVEITSTDGTKVCLASDSKKWDPTSQLITTLDAMEGIKLELKRG